MWISRVRITGGFLAGLDLRLEGGLNVVIGARGSGKTTLLELIRHALGVRHADERRSSSRQKFVESVLGSGEVILDVNTDRGTERVVVDASGAGRIEGLADSFLVLGQNELENIASDAASRLNLIDLRVGSSPLVGVSSFESIETITSQIFDLAAQNSLVAEQLAKRSTLEADRDVLKSQEAVLLQGVRGALDEKRLQLAGLEEALVESGARARRFHALLGVAADVAERLDEIDADVAREQPGHEEMQASLDQLRTAISEARGVASTLAEQAQRAQSDAEKNERATRDAVAPLRSELDEAESGLGRITAELHAVTTALANLKDLEERASAQANRIASLKLVRSTQFLTIESTEEEAFRRRTEIANEITSHVADHVVVVVDHFADVDNFKQFLTGALKGSNVRSAVVEAITNAVLPRQLLELVESGDANSLAVISAITTEQAARVVAFLSSKDTLRALSTIRLADSADFRLHDGMINKSVDELSTGQKCAVTLPIVLSERRRGLVLDQPEDHLDNAYLVDHVVAGMADRGAGSAQTIVATHNANIPVLGSAPQVVVLESDGRRGSVRETGPFDQIEIVDSITTLMEGGREAFARRFNFYNDHGGIK